MILLNWVLWIWVSVFISDNWCSWFGGLWCGTVLFGLWWFGHLYWIYFGMVYELICNCWTCDISYWWLWAEYRFSLSILDGNSLFWFGIIKWVLWFVPCFRYVLIIGWCLVETCWTDWVWLRFVGSECISPLFYGWTDSLLLAIACTVLRFPVPVVLWNCLWVLWPTMYCFG